MEGALVLDYLQMKVYKEQGGEEVRQANQQQGYSSDIEI